MNDPTRNLFYFFRGPSAGDESARDRQLENNLTKSLILVLEHADSSVFLTSFAEELDLPVPSGPVRFSLQRRPVGFKLTPRRIVLGVTGGTPRSTDTSTALEAGRPDAWIMTEEWTVLVEAKLGPNITEDQLRRHAESAGWIPNRYEIRYLTWQRLFGLFQERLTALKDRGQDTSRLLVGHWLEYLRGQQMVPFEKLEPDDFDYFNVAEEDRRGLMAHVRARVEAFQEKVAETSAAARILEICGAEPSAKWKHSTWRSSDRSAWFNIGGDDTTGGWHATVFFRPHGIDIEILGSGKGLNRRFVKLGADGASELVRLCVAASDNPPIDVGCRRAWYDNPDSGYKGQHIGHTDEPLMAHPRTLIDSTLVKFAEVLVGVLGVKHPAYRTELILRYSIPRSKIVKEPLGKQVAMLTTGLKSLERPFEFLVSKCSR